TQLGEAKVSIKNVRVRTMIDIHLLNNTTFSHLEDNAKVIGTVHHHIGSTVGARTREGTRGAKEGNALFWVTRPPASSPHMILLCETGILGHWAMLSTILGSS